MKFDKFLFLHSVRIFIYKHAMPQKSSRQHENRNNSVIIGVLTTLFLGAVGSGIWEVLFRPGLSSIGLWLASISNWFENEIYSSAALDPQQLPGLIGLLILCELPFVMAGVFLMKGFIEIPLMDVIQRSIDGVKERSNDEVEFIRHLKFRMRIVAFLGMVLCCGLGALLLTGFTLQNEATKVWRVSQSNIEIVAEHLADQEVRAIRAEFRMVRTRANFLEFRDRLNGYAAKNDLRLEWYGM